MHIIRLLLINLLTLVVFIPTVAASQKTEKAYKEQTINAEWYALQVKKYAKNAPKIALKLADEGLNFLKNHPNVTAESRILNESSYAYYFLGNYPKAMELAKKSQALAKSNKLGNELARSQTLQGNVLQAIGIYEHALINYKDAINYYRENKLNYLLSKVLVNIANTHFEAGRYSIAMNFYKQAEKTDLVQQYKAKYYLGFANTFAQQNKLDDAIIYYLKASKEYENENDQIGQELSNSGLGLIYLKQNTPNKAIKLFDIALSLSRVSGQLFREINTLCWKSKALLQLKKPEEALKIANQALDLATKLSTKVDQITAYQAKASALEQLGFNSKALALYQLIIELDIEVRKQQVQTQIEVMKAVFDLENKNNQIDLLSSKNMIQELNLNQQQFISLIIVIFILLLSISTFFFFYRKTQQKQLRDQQSISAKLKLLDIVKDQVMTNTSHELRTPLNGIIGMTQLLLETSEELNGEDAEKIEIIEQCGKRLLNLVQDITDFSQLQSRKLNVNLTPVDIIPIIKQAKSLLNQLAALKELKIEVLIKENLPLVYADKKRLHQILLNLIGNSIKFSQNGIITIKALQENNNIRVSVSDQGLGIPENKLAKIFEPFEQIDGSASRENEGSGLGLPITRELLLLHNSDISVTSTLGQGTTFTFLLPLATLTK
ncbi:ATP-binding protein [Aliikangiella sp. IMCC44359]|uniref:ATP-binding protein n=1 Tax=Aliikangiella sp. IMCC44359 TaxID=3459125 RepID=UPI00403AB381